MFMASLHSEFQDSQGYAERCCLKKESSTENYYEKITNVRMAKDIAVVQSELAQNV